MKELLTVKANVDRIMGYEEEKADRERPHPGAEQGTMTGS